MQAAPNGPTLLGVDVIWVATLLSAVATLAVMVAGLGGLIWMGIGAFIMAKMVNFEI